MWGSGEAFLCDLCRSRTSIFEVFAILGYVFHFCFHYMLHLQLFYFFRTPTFHFSCFLRYTYSNYRFFAQHIVCIRQKRTPAFHFSCFFGHTFPNCCSFYTTYGLYPQKNVPRHFFFPFFGVRMPKLPFISHNKYIVQFTQNLSKPLFITIFHKNNRPAFRSKRLFFQECFLIQFQVSQISS